MYITDAMICQHLYWPDIKDIARKKVTNCDTCQHKKRSNKEYGKLTAKLSEETPRNKMCVDIIRPYVIRIKRKKENVQLESVTVIDPVIGWFELAQYDDKRAIYIANLVETTWLPR